MLFAVLTQCSWVSRSRFLDSRVRMIATAETTAIPARNQITGVTEAPPVEAYSEARMVGVKPAIHR